jgi:hypothetical protein
MLRSRRGRRRREGEYRDRSDDAGERTPLKQQLARTESGRDAAKDARHDCPELESTARVADPGCRKR